MKVPPIAIIRTLPPIYDDPSEQACISYREIIDAMEKDPDECWFMALATKPKHEVMHAYVVINGRVDARFTLAGFREGSEHRLWDGKLRKAEAWAIMAGPVERPPYRIKWRGFRGFRYITDPLW